MASGRRPLNRLVRCIRQHSALAGWVAASLVSSISCAQDVGQLILSSDFSSIAERQPRIIQPIKALKPPELDGTLDDACWMACTPQELGSEMGGAVTRSTSVRVCYDEAALYMAFDCQEPAVTDLPAPPPPPKPNTPPVELPHDVWSADNVQAYLTFANEPEEQYLLSIGITGARYESSLLKGVAWSPAWQAKAGRTAAGWTAEAAIPLAALGNRRITEKDVWTINFAREISLSGERCSWAPTEGNRANPALWGTMFFGDAQALAKREQPTHLSMFPARWVIGADERILRMVVRIEPGDRTLAKCKLRLRLPGDAKAGVASRESSIQPRGQLANLILDATLLPMGDFELEAELVDADGATYGATEVKLRREAETAALSKSGQFDLLVADYGVQTRAAESWPMSVGVALPKGAVRDPVNVRLLDPAGAEVPCRGMVRGRWPGDGTIRWLTLDFRANLARGEQRLTVQYGPQVTAKPALGFTRNLQVRVEEAENIYVSEKAGAWWVNTGELLFKINQAKFSGVEQVWVDVNKNGQYDFNEQILNADMGGAGPYIADSSGRTYRIASDPNFRMSLEEWNELRIVLRGEGRLVPADAPGETDMGRCIMRLTAYAGQPFLVAQYTFIFNSRIGRTPLSDVGVVERLDFDFRRRPEALFGIPEGFRKPLKETGPVYMLIPRAGEYALQNLKEPPTLELHGANPQEWSSVAAPDRGMALCLRDMNGLYPKEFEIAPEGRMVMHFWPPHGSDRVRGARDEVTRYSLGRLDFAHSSRCMDLTVPLSYTSGLKDQNDLPEFGAVRDMGLADPTGIALTYDVLYFFYRGAANTNDISGMCRLFFKRPHATQSAESLAAAGVIPDMLPPERAERAAKLLDRLLALDKSRGPAEGQFNFQDVRRSWTPKEQRWKLENYWVGTAFDRPAALWSVYLQTGRADALLAAERAIRHMIDMDMCHETTPAMASQADPRRRKAVGGFGDHRTPIHWQSAWRISDRAPRVRSLLLAYYITGDLLARDMALLWAGAAKTDGAPFPGEDGMVFLDNLTELLELDYDATLLAKLGDCSDYLFRMPPMLDNADSWVPGLGEYFRQTSDPRVTEFLTRIAPSVPRDNLQLLGLLRDLQRATPSKELDEQTKALVAGYEQQVDKVLSEPLSKDEPLTWDGFCSYVFGATVPARTLAPVAPPAPAAPAPAAAPEPAPAEVNK